MRTHYMRVKSLSSHLGVTGNHESLARHKITVRVPRGQYTVKSRQVGGLPHPGIQRRFAHRFYRRRRLGRELAQRGPRPFELVNSGDQREDCRRDLNGAGLDHRINNTPNFTHY